MNANLNINHKIMLKKTLTLITLLLNPPSVTSDQLSPNVYYTFFVVSHTKYTYVIHPSLMQSSPCQGMVKVVESTSVTLLSQLLGML